MAKKQSKIATPATSTQESNKKKLTATQLNKQLAKQYSKQTEDFDPEDFGDRFGDSDSEDERNYDQEFVDDYDDSRARGPKKLTLRSQELDPELTTGKYAGVRASRKDLYSFPTNDANSEDEDEEGSDDEEQEDSEGENPHGGFLDDLVDMGEMAGSDNDDSEEDEEVKAYLKYIQGDDAEEDDEDEVGDSEENESADEDDHEEEEEDKDEEDDDEEQADSKTKKEINEYIKEEKEAISNITDFYKREMEKAEHVKNQKVLFDHFLKLRISMQKALNMANRLPQHDIYSAFRSVEYAKENKHQASVDQKFTECVSDLTSLVDDLVTLQSILANQNEELMKQRQENGVASAKKSKKENGIDASDLNAVWETKINPIFEQDKPYRNSTLDRWYRKARLSSGGGVNKKFKALNLDILTQIEDVLKDEERLIQRTQVKRNNYTTLGKRARTQEDNDTNNNAANGNLQERDPEIFDDTDFYQTILRELIQTGGGATGAGGSTIDKAMISQQERETKKARNGLERGATKGKRIRYNTHEKLVNFMVPIEKEIPPLADGIFARLFGGSKAFH